MSQREWSLIDIPSLEGQVIIVTGGNGGLGYEAVNVFAKRGAKVILASRSIERGQEAHAKLTKETPEADIEVMELNLGDLESVHQFAHAFKQKYDRLDILLNNAGVMTTPYGQTKDGFEQQLGINHLGHFALTGLLFDTIKKTAGARIVNISSNAHRQGKMDFDNLLFENGGYTPMKSYSQSKLANLLFTFELQRKLNDAGIPVKTVAAHPGVATTNLTRHIEDKLLFKVVGPLFNVMTQDAFNGALPGIRAATDPSVQGGEYFGPSGFQEFKGDPVVVEPITKAYDVIEADILWKRSEELTGVTFTI
ncbi:SDR family NAD(P)-dependent oxidoreductase [Halobacillus litoralis]|uniref:oxidoreductase n=1 Tax=Halobacillus litoralis TaxID=45668 RepID=UPI001CD73BA6|nr:oxidoreductase [Halobacillus litoralis]MCA0972425.1 SDR family NAD(P)-dependent oxidoreductase [Halobacillus litoralis]